MNVSSNLPPDSYEKLSRLMHTKDIFSFFVLIIAAIIYYLKLNFDTWYKAHAPYITMLLCQMDMLYVNCVCVLKACFKKIDDNLTNLRELVVNDEPHLLRRIYHEHRNSFLLMELRALKKQHRAINDTVQMLNTIFSLQLLATIILTFIELTFHLYHHVTRWKDNIEKLGMNNIGGQLFDLFSIISMIYYSVKIILIVWVCETGKDRSVKIGITVHDLLNNISDKKLKVELQLFSLQILQRENAFSAKDLIVDVTLLVAIVSNITTYLLILIQFLIAEKFCNISSQNPSQYSSQIHSAMA
ncbi:PREDICTED: putative gustatory receptor 28b [Wasmannia auropunctata]|uniref:putative gustatory receptor 28b n=1 Tax=Wasmannia auropunctata TaxID=64793 RepID=UPI0005F00C56|nr:PREDICTED: putative gustatory receptor 28b [Wasmannia auropunctata]